VNEILTVALLRRKPREEVILSQHSPGMTEESHENLRLFGVLAEIISGNFPDRRQKRYHLN
jgi:hypothetical protein